MTEYSGEREKNVRGIQDNSQVVFSFTNLNSKSENIAGKNIGKGEVSGYTFEYIETWSEGETKCILQI